MNVGTSLLSSFSSFSSSSSSSSTYGSINGPAYELEEVVVDAEAEVDQDLYKDPFEKELPTELVKHIFSYLDELSIIRSSWVNRSWRFISTQVIPLESIFKEYRAVSSEKDLRRKILDSLGLGMFSSPCNFECRFLSNRRCFISIGPRDIGMHTGRENRKYLYLGMVPNGKDEPIQTLTCRDKARNFVLQANLPTGFFENLKEENLQSMLDYPVSLRKSRDNCLLTAAIVLVCVLSVLLILGGVYLVANAEPCGAPCAGNSTGRGGRGGGRGHF